MDYDALFDRILNAVDRSAYLPLADVVDSSQRGAMRRIEARLRPPEPDPEAARQLAHQLFADGEIDEVMHLSALHVIAASPQVNDLEEAARLIAAQELAALRLGGANLDRNLASVDRHRGVLAFLLQRYSTALDYFSRAFERERSAGNLANVLATLLRLGEVKQARELREQVQHSLPADFVSALDEMIASDPDLALLQQG